ncbi:MAG: hypothetical protein EXR94_11590 [Gemmatimonadetes bacterium]|nr:hypothetical protein [Gemmatimonadota bacterium]
MQFIAAGALARKATETAKRFPFAILSAVTATTAAVLLVNSQSNSALSHLLMAGMLGLPLVTALELMAKRHAQSGGARFAIQAAGPAALLGPSRP